MCSSDLELLLAGEALLTQGKLERAEHIFRQVADSDPRNAIAVVGLARVALERGDERTAYQFARKALEIDPENAAAQRLAVRLNEVMAHRGEQPPSEDAPSMLNPKAARPSAAATPRGGGAATPRGGGAASAPAGAGGAAAASPGAGSAATPAAITNLPATTVIPPAAPRPTTRAAAPRRPAKRRGLIDRILGR